MKEVIKTGKTIEEAIAQACDELKVDRNEVTVEVLEIPKKGFLGLGQVEAKVKVVFDSKSDKKIEIKEIIKQEKAYEKDVKAVSNLEKIEVAKKYLCSVLKKMGIDEFDIEVKEESEKRAIFTLRGDNLGLVIGKRGDTLNALQLLCSLSANMLGGSFYNISLDVGNYRETREQTLKDLAHKIAKSVMRRGHKITLEPMSAYERKLIHEEIQNIDGVESTSKGSEPYRHIIVYPVNNRPRYRDVDHKREEKIV